MHGCKGVQNPGRMRTQIGWYLRLGISIISHGLQHGLSGLGLGLVLRVHKPLLLHVLLHWRADWARVALALLVVLQEVP